MNRYLFAVVFFVGLSFQLKAQVKNIDPNANVSPRARVIIDNDFGGDPDGLFQLVHHVLSPSVEIRAIIGSHIKVFGAGPKTAAYACTVADEVLKTMNLSGKYPLLKGADSGLADIKTPRVSEGAQAIIKEAMRQDTKQPLYVVCGAGLTTIASALLMEPAIANKIILVWIGGAEYTDIAIPPPGFTPVEYNMDIDIKAAQVVFNVSSVPLWQIPRNVYRQAIMSYAELQQQVKGRGEIGKLLVGKLEEVMKMALKYNFNVGETYVIGDSPLVLFTALQSSFEPDPASSFYVWKAAPTVTDTGLYQYNHKGRPVRVYTQIDNRLMFGDFIAKLALFTGK
jgi:purine nucleosidase